MFLYSSSRRVLNEKIYVSMLYVIMISFNTKFKAVRNVHLIFFPKKPDLLDTSDIYVLNNIFK